jgi:hypothetical protein
LQQELYNEVHSALGIIDDSVILASHETYEQRKQLFEHINEVLATRQDRFLSKFASGKAYKRQLTHEESDAIYTWYAEKINEMNKAMQNTSASGIVGGTTVATGALLSVEEQMIKIEDTTCMKYRLPSIYQLKDVISKKVKEIQAEEEALAKK